MRVFNPCLCTDDKNYIISFSGHENFLKNKDFLFGSSYHVLGARLLGFSYDDYLRFCRSCGAKLKGRKGYCYPVWPDKSKCEEICKLLQREWEKLLSEVKF